MEFMEVVTSRRSIRKFEKKPVPEETVKILLQAAMFAPSAGNQQPWHFIVVTERQKLDAVPAFHPYCSMIKDVSTAIVVCGAPDGKKWPDFWVQDCSAAIQNLLLAARNEGLGAVWTGVFPIEERMQGVRKLFNIPEDVMPLAIIPIGWPSMEGKKIDRYTQSLVHCESW